jgi:tetratricopeptide (TPR) repeat protein
MGNLEYASDNLAEAMEYYTRAIDIRTRAGDRAVNLLAISFLCLSRVYFQQKEYDTAFITLGKSEALFVRSSGAGAPFMAQ